METARTAPPLDRSALQAWSAAVLLDSMLIRRAGDHLVLMPLRSPGVGAHGDLIDVEQVSKALAAGRPAAGGGDRSAGRNDADFESYMHEGLAAGRVFWLPGDRVAAAVYPAMPWQVLRVSLPLFCAVVCVTAILLLCGVRLNILHLVGLLLVVAVGSNYALFFGDDAADSAVPQRQVSVSLSLLMANLTTVTSFGLLGASKVPVLAAIGSTVGIGAFLGAVVLGDAGAAEYRCRRTLTCLPGARRPDSLLVMLAAGQGHARRPARTGDSSPQCARQLPVDVMLVAVGGEQVMAKTVAVKSLREQVIGPALASGYRHIWLGGISLGAFNALHHAAVYAADLAGLHLLAPYPGTGDILREIEITAGGSAAWATLPERSDADERLWWHWLWRESTRGQQAKPLYLGLAATTDALSVVSGNWRTLGGGGRYRRDCWRS